MHDEAIGGAGHQLKWASALTLLVASIVLIRTAWISDDAIITLRCVLNFIHGYGATFNVDERVQAYTHPLWFGILSLASAIFNNVFYVTFATQILLSLAVLYLLLNRLSIGLGNGLLAVLVLICSKAYIDFSTSGLENPLSHLFLVLSVIFSVAAIDAPQGSGKKLIIPILLISLLYLVRPDLILLMVPTWILILWGVRNDLKQVRYLVLLTSLPIVLWTLISLLYYGFPFPNTAYAKLGAGIPLQERIPQGLWYFIDSLQRDPITISFIVIGIVLGLCGSRLLKALAMGIVLYLIYVLSLGGDFMSGRFFTAPLLLAISIVALTGFRNLYLKSLYGLLALFVAAMGLSHSSSVFSGPAYQNSVVSEHGIADERGFYFQYTGLWTSTGFLTATYIAHALPKWSLAGGPGEVAVICGQLGLNGIYAGPNAHLIDTCGLADPLLARLQAKYDPNWKIGHYFRQLPTGYIESVRNRTNMLADPDTRGFYESIRVITRSDIFDARRLLEILKINLGVTKLHEQTLEMYSREVIPQTTR